MTNTTHSSVWLHAWLFAILFGITLTQTALADVIYPAWVCIGLYGLIKLFLSLPDKKIFLSMLGIGMLCFLLLKPLIDRIEFWGDEIGVIESARKPFLEIAPFVQAVHAATPPLDYQNLHWWLKLVANIPLSEREFVWRIPYMLYHCLAAALFAQLLYSTTAHSNRRNLLVWVGWALYFFHPLGIEYGLDIRFYSLLLLSAVVLLYGVLTHRHTETWWLGLVFLAGLNAITFLILAWVTVLLYSLIALTRQKGYLPFINLLALISLSLLLAVTNTKSGSDLNYFSWYQYDTVVRGMASMNGFFIAVVIASSYWLIKLKSAPAFTIYTLLSAIWFICLLMVILIIRPYDGIGLRTFLPVLPHLFVVVMSLVIRHEQLINIAVILILLQLYWNKPNLLDHAFIERKIVHIKPLCLQARQTGQSILIVSTKDQNRIQTEWNYSFIGWYTSNYNLTVEFTHPNQIKNTEQLKSSYQIYDYDQLTQL